MKRSKVLCLMIMIVSMPENAHTLQSRLSSDFPEMLHEADDEILETPDS